MDYDYAVLKKIMMKLDRKTDNTFYAIAYRLSDVIKEVTGEKAISISAKLRQLAEYSSLLSEYLDQKE